MDKNGQICKGMRKEFQRLQNKYGTKELIPLHKENGTYHFWMQADQAKAHSLHGLNIPYLHPYKGNARQDKNP